MSIDSLTGFLLVHTDRLHLNLTTPPIKMTDVETQEPVSPAQSDPVANDDASSQSPGDESNIGDVKVGDTAQGKKVLGMYPPLPTA